MDLHSGKDWDAAKGIAQLSRALCIQRSPLEHVQRPHHVLSARVMHEMRVSNR